MPVADPPGMSTEGAAALMLPVAPSVTGKPPVGAGALSVTVHIVIEPGLMAVGLHISEVIEMPAPVLPVAPFALIATTLPSGVTARVLPMPIELAAEPFAVIRAMLPSPIAVALAPLARQVRPLVFARHVTVLPAAVRAGPAVTFKLDTPAG